MPTCFFCPRVDVHWCALCKAWLCAEHEEDWARRLGHATANPAETARKLADFLLGR